MTVILSTPKSASYVEFTGALGLGIIQNRNDTEDGHALEYATAATAPADSYVGMILQSREAHPIFVGNGKLLYVKALYSTTTAAFQE